MSGGNGDFGGETGGGVDGSNVFGNLLKGGLKGLGTGLQNYAGQQQAIQNRGGSGFQVPMAQQPNVQLPMGLQQPQRRGPNDLNFYGSSY